jgi:hypothetical protein
MGIKLVNGIETPLTAKEEAEIVEKNSDANLLKIKNENIIDKRIAEYGSIAEQLEYITENGLNAWQTKVQTIKTKYPKESE